MQNKEQKYIILTVEHANALVQYLKTRPWQEVDGAMDWLIYAAEGIPAIPPPGQPERIHKVAESFVETPKNEADT